MKNFSRFSSQSFCAVLAASAVLLPGMVAMGDSITTLSGRAGHETKLKTDDITINEIRKEGADEYLLYTVNSSNRSTRKALKTVVQIEVAGETLFNQAEAEFVKDDFKGASADYRKVIKKPGITDWMKQRCDERLLLVAGKTGDFLGAVAGFVELARRDPAAASQNKPTIDKDVKKDLLPQAISAVLSGLTGATVETKLTLNPFLAELYNANGQPDKADAVVKESNKLQAGAPAVGDREGQDRANAMALKSAEAESWLTKAKAAFAAKDMGQTLSLINTHAASFADPDHQAAALFLIAQAKEAQAAAANTQEAWEETALAYMRVVAHFKSLPGAPAADALYKTGFIEEKLQKLTEAQAIYNQVVNEYKDSSAAKDAQAALARIKAPKG